MVVAAIVAACVPAQQSATYPTYEAAAHGTGVYINGEQLSAAQKAELDQLIGESLPPGRYALDAQYNFGYEGKAPVFNLAAHVQQRQAQQTATRERATNEHASEPSREPFSMYSRDSSGQGSTLIDDGNGCMMVSTPSGSLSTGC